MMWALTKIANDFGQPPANLIALFPELPTDTKVLSIIAQCCTCDMDALQRMSRLLTKKGVFKATDPSTLDTYFMDRVPVGKLFTPIREGR